MLKNDSCKVNTCVVLIKRIVVVYLSILVGLGGLYARMQLSPFPTYRYRNGSVKAATVRTTDSPIKECHYNRFNINCIIMQAVQIYALKSGALKST
jgi:hypothetical protein